MLMMLSGFIAFSKNTKNITGTIKDAKGEALSFANVFLYHAKDSSLYKAAAADAEGKFVIEDLQDNSYYLKVSSVGYTDFFSPSFVINNENPSISFANIVLKESDVMLNTVQVTGKKPFIEQQIDKTVINVENSIVGSGSTALEVLEKAPGVIVDRQNDQIRLRNKSGVMVMIDGKQNYMSAEALAQYLNNMPSDQIESIEIITNPSSKYEAAGNSGIINIKLKKNKNYGTNGILTTSVGNGFLPRATNDLVRASTNLNLNHRNAKWNIFGNGNVGRSRWYNDSDILRSTHYEGLTSNFNQSSARTGGGIFYGFRGGADYFLSDKTTLGVVGDINIWNGKMTNDGLTLISENNGASTTRLIPYSINDMGNKSFSTNLNLRHKFNNKGKDMSFDIDYAGYRNNADQDFENTYTVNPGNSTYRTFHKLNQPTNINILSSKIDFTIPLENKVKLEFGAKSGYVFTDNNFTFENLINNVWQNDPTKSNHFKYKELINALYVNAGYAVGKWMFQGGLRAEHTHSDGHSYTTNDVNVRNYLNIFPTLFVNHTINDNNSVRYSYSKRVDRPNYQQLNPFLFFIDPYTYQIGNPFLNPQFTDSYEVTYTLKQQYSVSLSHAYTKHVMMQVLEQDDATRVTYQTDRNIASMKNYAANFSAPVSPAKWWNMHNTFSLYYNEFEDANVSGIPLRKGQLAYNIYIGNNFTMKKNWSAEASMWYNSPQVFGVIRLTKPQYAINAGVQKSFWDKKARLKLNVSDIFLTSFSKAEVTHANMNLVVANRYNARRVSLTFTYNFGNQNVKSSRKTSSSEDLKRRVGGNEG